MLPKQALYQAELHPERREASRRGPGLKVENALLIPGAGPGVFGGPAAGSLGHLSLAG